MCANWSGRQDFTTVPTETIPKKIAAGYVLVHNHVRHTVNTLSAERGFRGWFQKPSDRLTPCKCGWSGLPHYILKRTDQ